VGRGSGERGSVRRWPCRVACKGLRVLVVVAAVMALVSPEALGRADARDVSAAGCGPAAAGPPVPPGGVVQLAGTPHLFVCGADGLLHRAGDTRVLAQQVAQGQPLDWGARVTLGPADLRAFSRGDPWLSAGLLKWGDPIVASTHN
jgi:hypothetical protein